MSTSETKKNKLFYVVGASGSGKDSILNCFRTRSNDDVASPVLIAHRYITREGSNNEDSIYLSEQEFALREKSGLFSMSWQANGLHYGIGKEVEHWLSEGFSVLVNGSRAYLPQAETRFGGRLHSILVSVPEEELRNRLFQRSRENEAEIEQRLLRHRTFADSVCCDSELSNMDSIDSVVDTLESIMRAEMYPAAVNNSLQEV